MDLHLYSSVCLLPKQTQVRLGFLFYDSDNISYTFIASATDVINMYTIYHHSIPSSSKIKVLCTLDNLEIIVS